ncbi:BlaI/MecI/CopY family transcriptional regulator [Euzebya pacifica]|uniref:BlaI/MecI/CopY family transcriptional regulator n=1 Tax=Euzebya pacifica TaxID=1608957 RepID=UPI0030F7FC6D
MSTAADSPGLGSLEAKIMRVAWDDPGQHLQVRDVLARLDDDLAYTTVMTVMNRLHEKGLLRRRRAGRAWTYKPSSSREAYAATTMAEALAVAENRTAALLHFVADLDHGEAAALRRLLAADTEVNTDVEDTKP